MRAPCAASRALATIVKTGKVRDFLSSGDLSPYLHEAAFLLPWAGRPIQAPMAGADVGLDVAAPDNRAIIAP